MTLRLCLTALVLFVSVPTAFGQSPSAADSAKADVDMLAAVRAARTFGAGAGGALDPALPTIHEFADFACPTCRSTFLTRIDSVKTELVTTGRANLIVHAFPLPRLLRGPHAAEAAFCAAALGGKEAFSFMERHLYETQADWRYLRDPGPAFRRAAADFGLDAGDFDACLARDAVAPLIAADLRLGAGLGARGTPTFVFIGPGANEPADIFYGNQPLSRFEEGLERAAAE